jgi:TrkA domain protein
MDVNEVLLPGVGLRYEFTNHDGGRVGVIARRPGDFELVVYGRSDPDSSRLVIRLNSEEADTLAEILGAPRMAERFADLTKEVPGLIAGQVEVTAGSPFAGLPLGNTRARTQTGASIVAVVRSDDVIASPTPSEVLLPGRTQAPIAAAAPPQSRRRSPETHRRRDRCYPPRRGTVRPDAPRMLSHVRTMPSSSSRAAELCMAQG